MGRTDSKVIGLVQGEVSFRTAFSLHLSGDDVSFARVIVPFILSPKYCSQGVVPEKLLCKQNSRPKDRCVGSNPNVIDYRMRASRATFSILAVPTRAQLAMTTAYGVMSPPFQNPIFFGISCKRKHGPWTIGNGPTNKIGQRYSFFEDCCVFLSCMEAKSFPKHFLVWVSQGDQRTRYEPR